MGSVGSLACRAYPTRAPGPQKTSLTALPTRGEGMLGIEPGSPDHNPARYLYATATGYHGFAIMLKGQ